jgi:poly-gamma-glutamate capsule biosynthesis protein CapA/YwtB (metallophosphatase superfamily)
VSSGSATIALAGDVMLGRAVADTIALQGFAHPWGNLLPRLWEPDLFLINLECALTTETQEWGDSSVKPFHFRADPSAARTLRLARVDCATIANNHIADFGTAGLLETVRTLEAAGIAHAGAGPNQIAARAPARLLARQWRIAVVAFADHPPEWAAGPETTGLNYTPVSTYPPQFAAVERALAEARHGADFVVFSAHWGPNMRSRPTALFRAFARRVVDAGADVFWGHSAHVPQGVEVRNGKLILYDTGDFVDDYAVNRALRNDLSGLFLVRVGTNGVERLEVLPVRIGGCQVNLAVGSDRSWCLNRIAGLSEEMGTMFTQTEKGLELSIGAVPEPYRAAR